jgi:hypothetical protein
MTVYIGSTLSVVTSVYLLIKLGYFVGTGVHIVVTDERVLSRLGSLILIFCGAFLGYILALFVITVRMLVF